MQHFRGIYGIYLKLIKKNQPERSPHDVASLDLEKLGSSSIPLPPKKKSPQILDTIKQVEPTASYR